jgi:hypothetical protein
MNNGYLPALRGGLYPARVDRQAARALERLETGAHLARCSGLLRIERIVDAAERVAHISAMESVLVQAVPHADARLRQIADAGAAGIARVVLEAGL